MTSLMGFLLRSSLDQRSELLRRWGITDRMTAVPQIGDLYRLMIDQRTLQSLIETLPTEQTQVLAYLCAARLGEAAIDRVSAGTARPQLSVVATVRSMADLGLVGFDARRKTIVVTRDFLRSLRSLLSNRSPDSSCWRVRAAGANDRLGGGSQARRANPLIAISSPTSVRFAESIVLANLSRLVREIQTGVHHSARGDGPGVTSILRCAGGPAAEVDPWGVQAMRLALESALGLGLLRIEGPRVVSTDSLAAWCELDLRQQAVVAFEFWLSKRSLRAKTRSEVAIVNSSHKMRQLLRLWLAEASEGEWYGLAALLQRCNVATVRWTQRETKRTRQSTRDIIESQITDMHSLGCLDVGLDRAGKIHSFRLTSLGSHLVSLSGRRLASSTSKARALTDAAYE